QGKRPPHAVPGPVHNLVAGVGVEPTYEAYETSDWAASLTRNEFGPGSWSRTSGRSIIGRVLCHLSFSWMEPADGIEPSSVAYHATARPLSYAGNLTNWIPAADLNRALLITKQVRRHLRLRGTHWSLVPESNWVLRYKSCASTAMLTRRFPAAWSECGESNPVD